MPLSPEQEWILVACGLLAHADGILEVGEWDQVLWMLDDRIETADSDAWTEVLADAGRLRERLDALQPPPPFLSEMILEKAWRMALADGRGSEAEAAVHDEIANRLGVSPMEAAQWRRGWTERAARRAEVVAGFAAILANIDGRTDPDERVEYENLLARLPVPEDRRDALLSQLEAPPELDAIVGGLAALDPEDRKIALLGVVPFVHAAARGDAERRAFFDLAERVAVSRADAERMLDR